MTIETAASKLTEAGSSKLLKAHIHSTMPQMLDMELGGWYGLALSKSLSLFPIHPFWNRSVHPVTSLPLHLGSMQLSFYFIFFTGAHLLSWPCISGDLDFWAMLKHWWDSWWWNRGLLRSEKEMNLWVPGVGCCSFDLECGESDGIDEWWRC